MRFQIVIRYIAYSLLFSSLFMLISFFISLFNSEECAMLLLYSAIVTALFGVFPIIFIPQSKSITNKEGLLIVVGSWLLACIAGTLPYILWGGVFNFENAWFESVSGFTTTGSSILSDIESLPMGMLFWRAATHWLGGVGIILFVLSVLPNLGNAEIILYRSEVSSVMQENFNLQARKAIQILAGTYVVLTFLETIFLMLSGIGWFDAVTHSFATIATGGFSTKNSSIASFNNSSVEIIIIIFMTLSALNFVMLFSVITGNFKDFLKSVLVRYFILLFIVTSLISAFSLYGNYYNNYWDAFRNALFNIVSMGTSTGFATADTSIWPGYIQLFLMFFALQGGLAGSTSGGIKVDRIVIVFKEFMNSIRKLMHPKAVFMVKIDDRVIKDDFVKKCMLFVISYISIIFIGAILLVSIGVGFIESFSSSIVCMGGVGPGLGSVGSMGNYFSLPAFGKYILTIIMLLGRLEIFALFIFLTPAQWKRSVSY